MAVEKVVISVAGIKSANNFMGRELEGVHKGSVIETVNFAPEQLRSIKGSDEAIAAVKATLQEFDSKATGEHKIEHQIKLAPELKIVNKVGMPLELTGNIQDFEAEANLVAVTAKDKAHGTRYIRVIGLVLNVASAAEVPVYQSATIDDGDLFI